MTWTLPISGEYPPEWPEINAAACEAAGHRCIRCGHPYKKGTHGKGEWSPCDERCTHQGPCSFVFRSKEMAPVFFVGRLDAGFVVTNAQKRPGTPQVVAKWRILTVHHFDGNKSNCQWWNLLPLCQRCHLKIQTRVNPHHPFMFEHSEWLKPYVAGFYAHKYRGLTLTRTQVEARLDFLLSLERLA